MVDRAFYGALQHQQDHERQRASHGSDEERIECAPLGDFSRSCLFSVFVSEKLGARLLELFHFWDATGGLDLQSCGFNPAMLADFNALGHQRQPLVNELIDLGGEAGLVRQHGHLSQLFLMGGQRFQQAVVTG